MISICIPVYNFNVVPTVDFLLDSAAECEVDVEVLVFDDFSSINFREENRVLESRERVVYVELLSNMGRSRIRNCMTDCASGDWLLFLDSDMTLDDKGYLGRYHDQIVSGEHDVICGGVVYKQGGRVGGTRRESLRGKRLCMYVEKRRERAYQRVLGTGVNTHITTGNFCIRKETLERVRFNDLLRGYGQEDQQLWLGLVAAQARILCINNPTKHIGQDSNEVFLGKSEESLCNLVRTWNAQVELRSKLRHSSSRLDTAYMMRRVGLGWVVLLAYRVLGRLTRRLLGRGYLGMFFFKFYQLGYLLHALGTPNLESLEASKVSCRG